MIFPDIFVSVLVFVFGLIVGSFLNVCVVRMPQNTSIVVPRSHCVHCKKTIPWHDNIPVISYLMLKGRCRFCQAKISIRYAIVEITTAVLFLFTYQFFGMKLVILPYFIMIGGLVVATFIDFEHRIIPDEISVGGMVVGLVLSLAIPSMHLESFQINPGFFPHILSLGKSLLGVLVGGGSIYALGLLGDFIFKKESMGGGDVKFMAMVGAFLGWQLALLAFFIAPFFGALYGIIEKIRTKGSAIPYGPFLALGTLISLYWGNLIIAWILRGYGLEPLHPVLIT